MDDSTWREGIEAGQAAHKLPYDVQSQRSQMGAIRCSRSLCELEVSTSD